MHKLGIPDSAGITGKTLGHTVKLPAAVTYGLSLLSLFKINIKLPKYPTFEMQKTLSSSGSNGGYKCT